MKCFSDRTLEFFMAIRFNNNREFFHENHDWYLADVRTPALELADALSGDIEKLDAELERRPNRVVSRLARDIRFSRDKSPYRDNMWLSFRMADNERRRRPEFYFGLSAEGSDCGMGFYNITRAQTDAWRTVLTTHTEECIAAIETAYAAGFGMSGERYKKIAVPDDLDERLKEWYPVKNFWVNKAIPLKTALSEELKDALAEDIASLTPLYRLFSLIGDIE